jgi:ribonuclease T2
MKTIAALLALLAGPTAAQDQAGTFDYYILSLSWSPNWCALDGDARNSPQCDAGQDIGWVLHGLWPQFESGYPENCATRFAAPSRAQTNAMADVMGTSGLAWHEWQTHGVCTGLSPADYYAKARAAFGKITLPPVLNELQREVTLPATLIEEAFVRDNPGLAADQITITCKQGYIQEARICLTKDLALRTCGEDVISDCTLSDAQFEPIR